MEQKVLFFSCKVGKINCPVLLVNGCDDQNWAVTEYAKDVSINTHTHTAYSGHVYSIFMFVIGFDLWPQIVQQMKIAGKDHLLTLVEYPEAGHLIEPPYSPHFRATRFSKDGERGGTSGLSPSGAFLDAGRLRSSDRGVGGGGQTSFGCSGRLLEEDPGVSPAAPVLQPDSPSKDLTVQRSAPEPPS